LVWCFALTLFLSASLLFLVQPLVAKMILPLLGGAPAVWNTCMVFFQSALLAGYAYAHFVPARFSLRRQALVQGVLLIVPLALLPISIEGWVPPASSNPVLWLFTLLLVAVGLPFFVVATTAPLLQIWFAQSGHRAAHDPYFLYAASNVGSLVALLGYPLVIEPTLSLAGQRWLWAAGYVLLIACMILCASFTWRAESDSNWVVQEARASLTGDLSIAPSGSTSSAVGRFAWLTAVLTRLRWVLLAFVPSSLMLGVTTYITTDITPMPLLWVIPLALYLLTFVLVFSRLPAFVHQIFVILLPLAILSFIGLCVPQSGLRLGMTGQILLHLAAFFITAMVCHGELARDRPPVRHLTEYYLWMSFGGVLGGLFNALAAPQMFDRIVEYPLVMALACFLRPHFGTRSVGPAPLRGSRFLRAAATVCWAVFGLVAAAVFYLSSMGDDPRYVAHRERTFFGVLRIQVVPGPRRFIQMAHGTTLHGTQDPSRPLEPLSYYYRGGPIGRLFEELQGPKKIAVVGLGAGTLAAYAKTGQEWTFYEIDPAVERLAYRYFTFLRDCRKRQVEPKIILGDARLQLAETNERYDVIVLDAFSSDAVPVHLMTREAVAIYLDHLAADGMLIFHTSSLYFRLHPILANLAGDAGLACFYRAHTQLSRAEIAEGKDASTWVAMGRNVGSLRSLVDDKRWRQLRPSRERLWTDDYCNVLSAVSWKGLRD
jgi:spermidine synthase